MEDKILVLECAGLDMEVVTSCPALGRELGLDFLPLEPVFPAVTCTAQATMRTASLPKNHGIIANGKYDRAACKVDFWNQSAGLCRGERIWEKSGRKTGIMFTQQSLGEKADFCLSPAPIHKHHGGMIQACQTKPPELEEMLIKEVGRPFNLFSYWGPMASAKGNAWCGEATAALMKIMEPDLLFSYLPHLDYVLQREGPRSTSLKKEAGILAAHLRGILDTAKEKGYQVLVWGDYSITNANKTVYPNKALLDAGLFQCRKIKGMMYPNLYDSAAFAMADHQIAHVYLKDASYMDAARKALGRLDGIESIQTAAEAGLDCPEAGELVLTAAKGAWFSYQWWSKPSQAPDYASHVDIHSKIGFDPCELFWKIPMLSTTQDCSKVKGTHGRTDSPAAFAVTDGLSPLKNSSTLLSLSRGLKQILS